MSAAPLRYGLAWLAPGWRSGLRAPLPPLLASELADWLDAGRPAVVRRRLPGEEGVPLGIALPPGGAGRRAALLVAPDAVARLAPPLPLAEALPSAPPAWRPTLASLLAEASAAGLELAVHGSLAWQHLAGERYLHPASDVDLLVRPADAAALDRALALLGARGDGPPRLDGEVLAGDAAVSWRELHAGRPALLARQDGRAALLPRAAFLARLGAEAA
ncbi:MAG: malonate decarboxylase holo-[acyl-carrier-protein] synthase [Deltaproteobacteria bacterium]|nr:malonate decarboxylase holo-[acyl-carrier-protein] synthase [Deltaproteobacteria bacterium]